METRLLNISEFSRLSGISRKTLIYYDSEGIFSPAAVGKNRYRLYSRRQLQVANVIFALREINVPLAEIKAFLEVRTPKKLVGLCLRQEEKIRQDMDKLLRIQEVIQSLHQATESAVAIKPGKIETLDLPPARLFMGPPIDSNEMPVIDQALTAFYEFCAARNIPQSHPLGSTTRLEAGGHTSRFRPYRFYYPAGRSVAGRLTVTRPGGRYVVGHAYGDYGMLDGLYKKLLRFIDKNRLTAVSDAYEEYILNEMALRDPDKYLARVIVRVKK